MSSMSLIPPELMPSVNTVLLVVIFVYILLKQRGWKGINQHAEIETLSHRIDAAERNLLRVERDTSHWYRELTRSLENILKEVHLLHENHRGEANVSQQLLQVENHLTTMEQELTSLPCYMQSMLKKKAEAEEDQR